MKNSGERVIRKYSNFLIIISILAIILTAYLAYLHFSDSEKSFCDFGEGFSCDIVNKSVYSVFPPYWGVPVSILGMITFIILSYSAFHIRENKKLKLFGITFDRNLCTKLLYYMMLLGVLFALYLVYVELFILYTICVLCITLDLFILLALFSLYKLRGVTYAK